MIKIENNTKITNTINSSRFRLGDKDPCTKIQGIYITNFNIYRYLHETVIS